MNNYIPSGTSLFDFLAMVIPGGFIIVFIMMLSGTGFGLGCYKEFSFFFYIAFFVMSYLIGIIWNLLMEILQNFCIKISHKQRRFCRCIKRFCKCDHKYLKVYYKEARRSVGGVIIILETQVAFIKNMIIIVFIYGVYFLFCGQHLFESFKEVSHIFIGISLICISIILVFVMYFRQRKIYKLLFESHRFSS